MHRPESEDAPCQRPIDGQWTDRTGTRRRVDHPGLARLDLLRQAELVALAERLGRPLDHYEALLADLDMRNRAFALRKRRFEHALPRCPFLTVALCMRCGEHAFVGAERSWDVDRAMRRLFADERVVMAIIAHIEERTLPDDIAQALRRPAGHRPDLDRLSDEQLRYLAHLTQDPLS